MQYGKKSVHLQWYKAELLHHLIECEQVVSLFARHKDQIVAIM